MSLLNTVVFSIVADFLLSESGASAAADIHNVPDVPADAVISDVNSVPAVVGLPACCCRLNYFCKHPHFRWIPYCVSRSVVDFIHVFACISAIAVILAVAF